jgi:hypothetical protein
MDQARPTRRQLDWKPMGIRQVGRPRQRRQEDVMENLKDLKIKNWKETAKDRRTWRDLAEKVKTHKGLYCQMMMMMINFESYQMQLHCHAARRSNYTITCTSFILPMVQRDQDKRMA